MRSNLWLIFALCLVGCAGRAADPDPEVAIDGRSDASDFDGVGFLNIDDKPLKHTLMANKTMVVALVATTLDPFSVQVDAPAGDITLQLLGPLDEQTLSSFGALRARSTLLPGLQTHVFGFVPPQTGRYIALVSDAQGRAVDVTFQYVKAMAPAARFDVKAGELLGGSNADPAAWRPSWDEECSFWKQQMLDLSGGNVEQLDCGTPASNPNDNHLFSNPLMTIAIAGDAFTAPSIMEDGLLIEADSVKSLDKQCAARLTDAKGRFGARFLAATCAFKKLSGGVLPSGASPTIDAQPTLYLAP
jgi:hypothetical protein